MPQKIFEPFKKIPQQFQHLNLIQRLQGLAVGRGAESFGSQLSAHYGCIESPSAIDFDEKLSILAVGSKTGIIRVYGAPGFVLTVRSGGVGVVRLMFLPEEARLVAALADGSLSLFELNPQNGAWSESSRVVVTNPEKEHITSLALGHGIIYVGSSKGVLFQVAVNKGRLCLGDPALTSLTGAMVLESIPMDKRNELGVDSPIVALQHQPGGSSLLAAYSGGCVVILVPQVIPESNGIDRATSDATATSDQQPNVDTVPTTADTAEAQTGQKIAASTDVTDEPFPHSDVDASVQQNSDTPAKGHSEKKATLKLKELTRSLRRFELVKQEVETELPLPVPPPPRVSHVLLRDQPVEWATWRVPTIGVPSNEVTVAYGDGAFQVWPVNTLSVDKDDLEPVVVSQRDPPSTPYGPLPCGSIKKIAQCPGAAGTMLTIFSGGLPRAEFHDRHAVSVLQDPEHHVCFHVGSKVIDFILLPLKTEPIENSKDVTDELHVTRPLPPQNCSALLILTERELVAIDLQHPNWPSFVSPYLNCFDLSPVTAVAHLTKVSSALLSRLRDSAWYDSNETTHSQWPIVGGRSCGDDVDLSHNDCNDVVVLGHANGWITLLGIGRGDSMHRLGTFHTEILFNLADSSKFPRTVEVETWPPFRRVGDCALIEPFCQHASDSRLSITQLAAYATSSSITFVVGGAAGQVSVWTADEHLSSPQLYFEPDVSRILSDLADQDPSNFRCIWDGPPALKPFEGVTQTYGSTVFSPRVLIQLNPPAPITAVSLESSWNLLAVGCPFGFAVIDILAKDTIHNELMIPHPIGQGTRKSSRPVNVASVQTALTNRGKQITAHLRQSFRRLKNLRTSTSAPAAGEPAEHEASKTETPSSTDQPEAKPELQTSSAPVAEISDPAVSAQKPETDDRSHEQAADNATETVPSEVANSPPELIHLTLEDPSLNAVRSFLFADTFVISAVPATNHQPAIPSPRTPCLWVGTASGKALAYGLIWDGAGGPVTVQLHKELQLQHRAPVIGLCVLDTHSRSPVPISSRTRLACETIVNKPENTESASEALKVEESTTEEVMEAQVQPLSAQPESHQLLLCSEEQVKIFQLPTLRALHKFKFIDRLHFPSHFGTSVTMSSNNVGSEVAAAKDDTTGPETGIHDGESKRPEDANEVESKSSQTMSHPNRKSVRAFGLQAFSRSTTTPDQPKAEWNVVVVRQDGQSIILSLPHLRKLFKVKPIVDATHCVPCVASLSDANYVFWQSTCQLIAYELSLNPRLVSPALLVSGTRSSPSASIVLPDWARPQQQQVMNENEPKTNEEIVAASNGVGSDTAEVPLIDECADFALNGTADVQIAEPIELAHPLPEKYNPATSLHAGDMTIDSIKEYLNGEGTVTIKTIETSTEKRTLVEGGHIVTTVRETECIDGQITKDDMLKFSTDDPVAPYATVESS